MIDRVCYASATQQPRAESLARQMGLNALPLEYPVQTGQELILNVTADFTELRDLAKNIGIHIDFIAGALAHRREYGGGKNQPLARAVGMKPGYIPRVLDATAGLAKDAFVLASLGCPVVLLERSPFVAALIEDAIARAASHPEFSPLLEQGFELINEDAIDYLTKLEKEKLPDTIYLDPMYPEKQKSALVKKNMQILQKLLGQDDDSTQLLQIARRRVRKRVVVKRPKGAEHLGDLKPAFEIASKNTRYDIYLPVE